MYLMKKSLRVLQMFYFRPRIQAVMRVKALNVLSQFYFHILNNVPHFMTQGNTFPCCNEVNFSFDVCT